MSKRAALVRPVLVLALALGCALAWTPAPTAAEGREFNGVIVRVGGKQLLVKNRMGDERRFHRNEQTAVRGKPGWAALAAGDRVIVQYTRGEERNRVTRVIVLGARN